MRSTVVCLQCSTIDLTYFFCSLNLFQSHIFVYKLLRRSIHSFVYISLPESLFYDHAMRIKKKNEKLHFNPINGSTYEWSYHNCITAYMQKNVSLLFLASFGINGISWIFLCIMVRTRPILYFWIFKRLKRVMFLRNENITGLFVMPLAIYIYIVAYTANARIREVLTSFFLLK